MENKPTNSTMEIRNMIYSIRGKQVMLDSNLIAVSGEKKTFKKAVK